MNVQTDYTRVLMKKRFPPAWKSSRIKEAVHDQDDFDELFGLLFYHERPLIQRTANAVDKITQSRPEYLEPHRNQLLSILKSPDYRSVKANVVKLIPRLTLSDDELEIVWHLLSHQALNPNENKSIRLNALQSLYDLSKKHVHLKSELIQINDGLKRDPTPSIQARLKRLSGK